MAQPAIDMNAIQTELKNDSRKVSDLWNAAIHEYTKKTKKSLVKAYFPDTKSMKAFGVEEMEKFHNFRHDGSKINKLTTLFMENVDNIEAGSKLLMDAVATAFPPAAAISTAMTFILSACKAVSAQYDVVINFFEDMNNFLKRVTIIEKRVPRQPEYRNALMDVFTSFLQMCAVAHVFIEQKRFKRWIINVLPWADAGELATERDGMNKALETLIRVTEFAILDNTEKILDTQIVLEETVADFREELRQNKSVQARLVSSQTVALQNVTEELQKLGAQWKEDMQKLLAYHQKPSSDTDAKTADGQKSASHRIKAMLPKIPDVLRPLSELRKFRVEDTCRWFFETSSWVTWKSARPGSPVLLYIQGDPGIGKSYIALAAYDSLKNYRAPDVETCTAYFACRADEFDTRDMWYFVYSIASQIADQNKVLRQILEEKLGYDDAFETQRLQNVMQSWLYDVFTKTSGFQLFIVFDDVDELMYDEHKQDFSNMVRRIEEQDLRIKIISTGRTIYAGNPTDVVQIGKKEISQDLQKIVWDRLHSNDSAYKSLKKLSLHTKQRLARNIEQSADGLLYVEQILRYLGGFTRESQIDQALDAMPNNVMELYQIMLEKFQRQLPLESLAKVKSVVIWISFSFLPLTLEMIEAISGLTNESADGDILDILTQFFEVEHASNISQETSIDIDVLFMGPLTASSASEIGNNKLQVKPRDRSMILFFGSPGPPHQLRGTASDAHSLIFLDSVRIICDEKNHTNLPLHSYAVLQVLHHWAKIEIEGQAPELKIEMFEAFDQLITSSMYTDGMRRSDWMDPWRLNLSTPDFERQWMTWARVAKDLPLPQRLLGYWNNKTDSREPILQASIRSWLQTYNPVHSLNAYKLVQALVQKTKHGIDLQGSPQEDFLDKSNNVKRLAELSGHEMDHNAHYAMGVVLFECEDISLAVDEVEQAISMCSIAARKAQYYLQVAEWYVSSDRYNDDESNVQKAIDYCELALGIDRPGLMSRTYPIAQSNSNEQLEVSNATAEKSFNTTLEVKDYKKEEARERYCLALRIKIKALLQLDKLDTDELFQELREMSTVIVPAEHLYIELSHFDDPPDLAIDTLIEFGPLRQMQILTDSEWNVETVSLLCKAAASSKRYDEVKKIYQNVITTLDSEDSGAPLRNQLANILWKLGLDTEEAKALLNQVLDSVKEGDYKLTNRDSGEIAFEAMSLYLVVLQDQFRNSKNGEDKRLLLSDVENLPKRSLLATSALTNTSLLSSQIVLARMLAKIGPTSDYEKVMKRVFKLIIHNLTDRVKDNNAASLVYLAQILMLLPPSDRLRQIAGIIMTLSCYDIESGISIANQDMDPTEELKYDAITEPICCVGCLKEYPTELEKLYNCMVCPESTGIALCQECYEKRLKWNAGPNTKPYAEPQFCCCNGKYLLMPVKGWRGVKNRVVYLDPEDGTEKKDEGEPRKIGFNQLLGDIKQAWEAAWEDFWFGI